MPTSRTTVTSLPSDFHSSLRVVTFSPLNSLSLCLSVCLPSCLPVSTSSISSLGKRRSGNIKLSSLSGLAADWLNRPGNCTNKSSSGAAAADPGGRGAANERMSRLSQREIDSEVPAVRPAIQYIQGSRRDRSDVLGTDDDSRRTSRCAVVWASSLSPNREKFRRRRRPLADPLQHRRKSV